ncbi:helix-turn-helix domain-containing protein [Desulfoprunum benzoelyticum]|uniref:helix-turn-helix domain-containing protein n=1 Tax=Desulfoprunum benzoelyticum TaxID=1506996 RepID=UPI00338F8719
MNEQRSGNFTLSELCRHFEISSQTAYKFIKRYETEGIAGLEEKQRSLHDHLLYAEFGGISPLG